MSDIRELPAQIIILGDAARSRVLRALEEGSLEKVRDLLLEIKDCLNTMTDAADAAILNEEDSEKA